jgi:HupE / UreJ protein
MRALRIIAAIVAILLIGVAAPASAHTRSETFSSWQIAGSTVHMQFLVPDLESKRITKNGDMPTVDELGRYIAAHVGAFAGDQACPMTEGPRQISSTAGFRRYEFTFECPQAANLKVHSSAWFDLVESHTNFAQIQDDKGNFVEQLVTKDRQTLPVTSESGESSLEYASFLDFVRMGIMHIFTGVDHMSFMLGLVLISRRLRDLLFVVTGFTLGHSLTLALAVTGVLRPEAQYIDSLVALTIALIGAENIGDSTRHPLPVALGLGGLLFLMAGAKYLGAPVTLPTLLLIGGGIFTSNYLMLTGKLYDAARVRLVVTLVFGLIHGFGFATDLLERKLPTGRLAELLVGFNLGVEIGQVTVVLGALAVAWVLVKARLGIPRPIFTDIAASFLVGEGLFWFLSRTVVEG